MHLVNIYQLLRLKLPIYMLPPANLFWSPPKLCRDLLPWCFNNKIVLDKTNLNDRVL